MPIVRRAVLFAGATLLLFAIGCSKKPMPGVEYTFSTEILSASINRSSTGSVSVAGDFAALEFDQGDGILWKEHVILITDDGGKSYTVVLPGKKSYYEADETKASEMMRKAIDGAMSKLNLEISDISSSLEDEGADDRILDYPTRRYRHEMQYDMTMSFQGRGFAATTQVITKIWTTDMIAERYASFLRQQQARTGLGTIDEVLANDMQDVKGFPLKQVVRSVVTVENMEQTSTATLTIDDFVELDIPYARFEVPDGFDEIEPPTPDISGMLRTPS